MSRPLDPLRLVISNKILRALEPLVGSSAWNVQQVYDLLVEPPQSNMGDWAFPCFGLAKQLKKGPPQIAGELKNHLAADSDFKKVDPAGPYLNLTLSEKWIGENVLDLILKGTFLKPFESSALPKTMIEFSQPNTHKELHVGHMRNACLGDALVRLHRYCGYPVISSTFPGDMGTHVAKCLWYLKYHNQEPIPQNHKGEWLGKIYSRAHLKLEDDLGTPKEDQNRQQLTAILKELESEQGEFFRLWQETREWSVQLMKSIYQWADIEFDKWYWESEVDQDSVRYVKELYQQGKLVLSEGAIGMDLSQENLGFCLLLKSDGTGLYATKDLELARKKFADFQIQKSLYVVDMRQALHFQQVFKTLEKLGFEQARDCVHLQYNFVELPDGAMSSRKGNIVPLTDLINKMQTMVKETYLSKYENEWTAEDIRLVSEQVAKGAIKYGMLRMDSNKKIVFDMQEWLKIDGESGPFIQYSYARIQSVLRKFPRDSKTAHWSLLQHPSERALLQSALQFRSIVVSATDLYRPSLLCTFLYQLAQKFNHFYHECSIGQAETPELQQARLALSEGTGLILKQGLSILGIPAPLKM